MQCPKCKEELPEEYNYCPYCGRKLNGERPKKKRGNGQGSVYKHGNKYVAAVTLGYDANGKRKTRTKWFDTKKEAVLALSELKKERPEEITFGQAHEMWLETRENTPDSYKYAWRYLERLENKPLKDITIDALQSCIDDSGKSRQYKSLIRTIAKLIYDYAIPRGYATTNLAQYLKVGENDRIAKASFTPEEIEKIKNACGKVPQADMIYCMIYTGFRPSEMFALTDKSYDPVNKTLMGGSKTEAGKNRIVTLSPKIQPIIAEAAKKEGYLFANKGKKWTQPAFADAFIRALDQAGIDNPIIRQTGAGASRKYTPHSCRHTFATLMKRVDGGLKDKQSLIGHASANMLLYYEDTSLADKRAITDKI